MLTTKQKELLMFIHERLKETGVPPSFDEMKEALDLRSKSGIHRLITALEERGFVRRLPHRARALDVVRLPEDQSAKTAQPPRPAAGEDRRAGLNVIRGDFTPSLPGAVVAAQASSALQLPLYGKIAAGTPIEALRDNSNSIDVPATLVGRGEHYAMMVDGDSMVDAGIQDGDTVVIEQDCYQGTINRYTRLGVTPVGIPLDRDGMRMDALSNALDGLKRRGVRPKFIYTIPTVQNPTGTILPVERRETMLRLAEVHGVPVFEDDCYCDLIWEG